MSLCKHTDYNVVLQMHNNWYLTFSDTMKLGFGVHNQGLNTKDSVFNTPDK